VAEHDAVDGCTLKSRKDGVDASPLLGYVAAGASGRHGGGQACGSERSPWLVTARRGQRVRFTLMDFSSSTVDDLDVNHVADDAVQSRKTSRHDNSGPVVVREIS